MHTHNLIKGITVGATNQMGFYEKVNRSSLVTLDLSRNNIQRKDGGHTAAGGERTDGQTEQPPVFTLHTHLHPDSEFASTKMLNTDTHMHSKRQHVTV